MANFHPFQHIIFFNGVYKLVLIFNVSKISNTYNQKITEPMSSLGNQLARPQITENIISETSSKLLTQHTIHRQQSSTTTISNSKIFSQASGTSHKIGYVNWASEYSGDFVIAGSTDQTRLLSLKESIQNLKNQYLQFNKDLSSKGIDGVDLNRRFLMIQHQVDRLFKGRVDAIHAGNSTGNKVLDIDKLLLQRENTIIQLEKQNQNLRARLKLAGEAAIELQLKIQKLTRENFSLKGYTGTVLDDSVERELNYAQTQKELAALKQTFASTIGIWYSQLQSYKAKYPEHQNWQLDFQVTKYIEENNIQPIQVNGYSIVEVPSVKVRKWLRDVSLNEELNLLIRKSFVQIIENYPNIKTSVDSRIIKFISDASNFNISDKDSNSQIGSNLDTIIDVFDQVSLNRLVGIIKYVPEPIRVQNVYSFTSNRAKKVEFHLRVLIKALLEQFQKLKIKYGAVLEIDEAIIALINQEILDIVNVDDILKIFRVKERIVEVDRIVEKVVQRIVEVPKLIPVQKYVQKIVQVPKYIQVEKIIHKPVEVIKVIDKIVQKFIQVPTIQQKIIQVPTERQIIVSVQKQVPKIIQVQKFIKQVVVDTKYVQIEKPVNHVITKTQVIEVIKQIPIVSEVIREVIKPVEIIVEKIVPIEVVTVKLVEIEKVVEKVVKEIEYLPMPYNQLVIKEKIVEVPVYIQKLVPVETIVNKIVNVPQRIEVPVIVKEIVPLVKEVEVLREKIVQKIVIKEIERVKNIVVENVVERIKTVEKKIEVPIIQDRIVKVPIHKVVVERVHTPHVVPVKCIEQKIIEKIVYVEVEKPYVKYIKDIQVVHCAVEKIVEVPRTIEKIKEVRVFSEKIVNKLVEVPRVVEVEKAVEKIVVVPRIIQKIVQVPQIVQVIVEKIVQVPTVRVVQVAVEKIVYVDKPVQIQKINNIYHEVNTPVEVIKEIPVLVETVIEKKQVVEIEVDKLVTVNTEIPVQIIVENVVERVVECTKVFVVQQQDLLVVEVPRVVDRIYEKAIPIKSTIVQHKEIHIPIEVPVKEQTTVQKIVQVEKIREKAVKVVEPKIVTQTQIVVNQKFSIVPETTKIPIVLPAERPYLEPIIVDRYIQKPVEVIVEVRQDKPINITNISPIDVYKIVEITRDNCFVGTEHKVIHETVDKVIHAHTYEQYPVEKEVNVDKVIDTRTFISKVVPQVQNTETIVQKQNFQIVQNVVPYYETKVQSVDRFESTQVHSFTTQQKIVSVPTIQEKIYERIVVMPQVVQVVKYITQICEKENSLVAEIPVDVIEQEKKYRELYELSQIELDILLIELKKHKGNNFHALVQRVQKYLLEFHKFASIKRIVPVDKIQVIQQNIPKPVLVPVEDSQAQKSIIAYSLLIQKLIIELKRVTKQNSGIKLKLDNDLSLLFFKELNIHKNSSSNFNFQESLAKYTKDTIGKLNSLGGDWNHRHELMLSTILAERFAMAEYIKKVNIEVEKARALSIVHQETITKLESRWLIVQKLIKEQKEILNTIVTNNTFFQTHKDFLILIQHNEKIASESVFSFDPIKIIESIFLTNSEANWSMAASKISELQLTIKLLNQKLSKSEKQLKASQTSQISLRQRIDELTIEIEALELKINVNAGLELKIKEYESKISTYTQTISEYQLRIKEYESKIGTYTQTISALQLKLSQGIRISTQQVRREYQIKITNYTKIISQLEIKLSQAITISTDQIKKDYDNKISIYVKKISELELKLTQGSKTTSQDTKNQLKIAYETIQTYRTIIYAFRSHIEELINKINTSSSIQFSKDQSGYIKIYEQILKISGNINNTTSSSTTTIINNEIVNNFTLKYTPNLKIQNQKLREELNGAKLKISQLQALIDNNQLAIKLESAQYELKLRNSEIIKYKANIQNLTKSLSQIVQAKKKVQQSNQSQIEKQKKEQGFWGVFKKIVSSLPTLSYESSYQEIIYSEGGSDSQGISTNTTTNSNAFTTEETSFTSKVSGSYVTGSAISQAQVENESWEQASKGQSGITASGSQGGFASFIGGFGNRGSLETLGSERISYNSSFSQTQGVLQSELRPTTVSNLQVGEQPVQIIQVKKVTITGATMGSQKQQE